ncbi:nuclease-related domain-containing protein [Alteribacter populi]|uniref:nuclease-related domain-containing protein n=1 Tax=Alteribacter populi TaxID=2011011 RepID=UPI0012FF6A7F|nr:nuclease-related domain-containing protein [Alteribacter populi]
MNNRKPRKTPLDLLVVLSMIRRLPPFHPQFSYLENDHASLHAGFRGEKSVEFYLKNIPRSSNYIYHNLRLMRSDNNAFEIDTLIVFPNYLLILEIKHFSGESVYLKEEPHQLIRTSFEKTKKAYDDPILQVKQQKKHLHRWLKKHSLPSLPIEYLVIMANPHCEITFSPNYIERSRVMRSTYLEYSIRELDSLYKKTLLSQDDLERLDNLLLNEHSDYRKKGIEKYSVPLSDLIKGVHCPKCFSLPMLKMREKWICQKCNFSSKHAIVDSLRDYFLLVGDTITNKELRNFCMIPTSRDASRLLKSLKLPHNGGTKSRSYELKQLLDR